MVDLAATVWRDFVTDGVPSSGANKPNKAKIRAWGTYVESQQAGTGLIFAFSATTADADPGTGEFRLNNVSATAATALYIDNVDGLGTDVGAIISSWDDSGNPVRGLLNIRGIDDDAFLRVYRVTGTVVDGSGYRKVTVAHIGGSGSFVDGNEYLLTFSRSGEPGAVLSVVGSTNIDVDITDPSNPIVSVDLSNKWTFDSTLGGIEMSGAPNISKAFAGDTPNFAIYQTATAASDTIPEYGAHFGIVSAHGQANPISAHKVALSNDATAQAGSAGVWAQTSVVNLEAGADASIYAIGHEIDINVRNAAYSTNGAPYATNLLLTGTTDGPTHYAQAGLVLAYGGGVDPLWNYGILGVDYSTARAFKTAFISDQSRSPTILHSDTAHTTGIDFGSASFSGNVFVSPGYILDSAGNVNAAQGRFNGPVIPNTDDGFALGSAALRWSDLFLAEGGVINWDNGDVTITQANNVLAIAGTTSATFDGAISNSITTQSTSVSTGAIITAGGLGVAKDIFGGGKISALAASGFYLGANQALFQSGNYTLLNDSEGAGVLQSGNTADPTNYLNNTSHAFRNRAGSTTFATINATGLGVGAAPANALLSVAAGTTALAQLYLPVSATPSAPVDGQIWRADNTNTGLKIRINGVTKSVTVA